MLDCTWGFWKTTLFTEDRYNAAVNSHAETFQYKRIPFDLCNAPDTFQRMHDILLSGPKWVACLIYVADVIVYSEILEDHLEHVDQVF